MILSPAANSLPESPLSSWMRDGAFCSLVNDPVNPRANRPSETIPFARMGACVDSRSLSASSRMFRRRSSGERGFVGVPSSAPFDATDFRDAINAIAYAAISAMGALSFQSTWLLEWSATTETDRVWSKGRNDWRRSSSSSDLTFVPTSTRAINRLIRIPAMDFRSSWRWSSLSSSSSFPSFWGGGFVSSDSTWRIRSRRPEALARWSPNKSCS
mmetsp:Transcript_26969/g.63325  ORF Transcript_26969/g.63325 Transcript_26969/m.63325 type:complete len:214 (-) Transcript_26969:265-906(-)